MALGRGGSACGLKLVYQVEHSLTGFSISHARSDVTLGNMKLQRFILVLFGLFHTSIAIADSDERLQHFLSLSLEELVEMKVTISTDTKQTVARAPGVVSVITAEDIKATGATNLVDVLESVPGIHVRASQFANRPLVHIRGANATQTLLMVNGAPMRDLIWGFGIFWKGLPASIIERVEIIRGPGSALFGSDASSGVINVITKTAGKIEKNEVGARIGSFDTKTAWTQYGGNWNGFDMGFTAELGETDGHDPFIASDRQTLSDQAFGTHASLAPGAAQYGWRNMDLRLSVARDHWRLQADYVRHSDLEIGLTGAGVLDPVTQADDSRFNAGWFYANETFSQDWGLNAELRYQHLDYSSGNGFQERPPGFLGGFPDGVINRMKSAERRVDMEASGLYSGIDAHAVLLGAGYSWQDLYVVEQQVNSGIGPDGLPLPPGAALTNVSDTPFTFAPEKSRTIKYLFLQDIWTISDDWELTAGARYDHYSDFGDTLNPRLALVWQSTDSLTTKLMYGQAFRAPSFQELFAETSFTLPNPNLDPERSETLDLSFSYSASKDLYLNFTFFHFDQTDLIRAVSVPGSIKRQFQNTGDHRIRGIEFEARWQATKDLRISGNYTARDQDDSEFRAVQVPDREAYLRADWVFVPGWNWDVQANWIGQLPRVPGDIRPPVDDYWLADTTLRYAGLKNWEFAASVRNLFDVDARAYTGASIAGDLPLPERNYYLELRWKP